MGYERGVGVVGDDDAGDAFGAAVGVEGVICRTISLPPSRCVYLRCRHAVPCSSTSCRCPGRVRSATVLLNSVMNSP